MAQFLIIDDEPSICWALKKLAESLGHSARFCSSAELGWREAEKSPRPDVLFLDVRLPGIDGLAAMAQFREALPLAPIVVMTAHGELQTAVDAIRHGAFEYLTKPFDLELAERVMQRAVLRRRQEANPKPIAPSDWQNHIVGRSPPMQDVFKQVALVAASDAGVLITGDPGTGKELVARSIHRFSRRADKPFVAVDVTAMPPSLAECELFGCVEGASSIGERVRVGQLEQAQGGTVFLDDVTQWPVTLQVKFLRAIEYGEVTPIGSDQPRPIDIRVIAATNRSPQEEIVRGSFRLDLFFRLAAFQIGLPPLRDRGDDVRELAEHFVARLTAKDQLPRPTLSKATLAELARRAWPGNVRELRNAMEHAAIVARGGQIEPDHLPCIAPLAVSRSRDNSSDQIAPLIREWAIAQLRDNSNIEDLYERFLALVEPPLLDATLAQELKQCSAAAKKLGLHRHTLRKKLDQYGIE